MRLPSLLLSLGLAFVLTLSLSAQTVRVVFVSGQAELQRPDEAAPRPVVKGETVVIGTRIATGEDGRVVLTPMPGVKSIIAPNTVLVLESSSETRTSPTEVTHQAVINLQEGSVVSDLQRPEGVAYDYSIRTARGLAGARGTVFAVGINPAGIQTVIVSEGSITLNFLNGTQATLATGRLSLTDASGATREVTSITDLPPEQQAVVQSVAESAIAAIAEAIEAGLDVDQKTLDDALAAAEALGITLSPELQDLVARVLALLALQTPASNDVDTNTISEVITKQIEEPAGEEPITGFPSLSAFIASLSEPRQMALLEILDLGFNPSGEALLTDRLQDQAFVNSAIELIDVYIDLVNNDINPQILVQLGILGDNNITVVGADPVGLYNLVSAYSYLSYSLSAPELLNELDFAADRANFDPLVGSNFFFPGVGESSGTVLYNVTFDAVTAESYTLNVGATRTLKIDNTGFDADAFKAGDSYGRVELRASDLVDLNNTRFATNITDIVIAAATINLSNIKFEEGAYVYLYSKYGSANFGSSQFGKVNFITNVRYGDTTLDQSNFGDGVRGYGDVTGGRVIIDTLDNAGGGVVGN